MVSKGYKYCKIKRRDYRYFDIINQEWENEKDKGKMNRITCLT